MSYRLAIVETHPIQYKIPWFRLLYEHSEVAPTVFYCMLPDAKQQGDGFGVEFRWDVPLLDGYAYKVLENVAKVPSVTSFFGCDTPAIADQLPDNCDAVIVNGWVTKSCLQTLLACRRSGIPCIVRGEANDIRKRVWWKRVLQGVLVRRYAAALYIGRANRGFYLARGVSESRMFFGPYCIDNDRFAVAAAAADRRGLRKKWRIPENAVCFLFSGKLQPKKRPMDILHALKTTTNPSCLRGLVVHPDSHDPNRSPGISQNPPRPSAQSAVPSPPVHLLIAGDGELRRECETFARKHHLPISFTGFLNQSELPGAYAVADCLVLPSDNGETWGLVVNEAMACGLPAIVSDQVGCAADLVTPGETGFVFPCGDVNALATCMRQAIGVISEMADACRRRVATYSYAALVNGTVEAVERVMAEKPKS